MLVARSVRCAERFTSSWERKEGRFRFELNCRRTCEPVCACRQLPPTKSWKPVVQGRQRGSLPRCYRPPGGGVRSGFGALFVLRPRLRGTLAAWFRAIPMV